MPTLTAVRGELVEEFLATIGQAESGRDLGLRLDDGQPEVVPRHVALCGQGCCGIVDIAVHQLGERKPACQVRECGPSVIVAMAVTIEPNVPSWYARAPTCTAQVPSVSA